MDGDGKTVWNLTLQLWPIFEAGQEQCCLDDSCSQQHAARQRAPKAPSHRGLGGHDPPTIPDSRRRGAHVGPIYFALTEAMVPPLRGLADDEHPPPTAHLPSPPPALGFVSVLHRRRSTFNTSHSVRRGASARTNNFVLQPAFTLALRDSFFGISVGTKNSIMIRQNMQWNL